MKKIDIRFSFNGQQYDAIIRVFEKAAGREFYITVLDWELERLLYGNQMIEEVDGIMNANVLPEKKEQTKLKLTIASNLSNYLKIPCFTGDACVAADV
jgi:hypothetical protein